MQSLFFSYCHVLGGARPLYWHICIFLIFSPKPKLGWGIWILLCIQCGLKTKLELKSWKLISFFSQAKLIENRKHTRSIAYLLYNNVAVDIKINLLKHLIGASIKASLWSWLYFILFFWDGMTHKVFDKRKRKMLWMDQEEDSSTLLIHYKLFSYEDKIHKCCWSRGYSCSYQLVLEDI